MLPTLEIKIALFQSFYKIMHSAKCLQSAGVIYHHSRIKRLLIIISKKSWHIKKIDGSYINRDMGDRDTLCVIGFKA